MDYDYLLPELIFYVQKMIKKKDKNWCPLLKH